MRTDYEFKRIDINENVMRDACTKLDERVSAGEPVEEAVEFVNGHFGLDDEELDELNAYAAHAWG